METDDDSRPGMVLVAGEMVQAEADRSRPDWSSPTAPAASLGPSRVTVGRLPDCTLVLADPNVSRYHAEFQPLERRQRQAFGVHGRRHGQHQRHQAQRAARHRRPAAPRRGPGHGRLDHDPVRAVLTSRDSGEHTARARSGPDFSQVRLPGHALPVLPAGAASGVGRASRTETEPVAASGRPVADAPASPRLASGDHPGPGR